MIKFVNIHHHQPDTKAETGIQNIIVLGKQIIDLSRNQYFSIGIHPWYILDEKDNQLAILEQLAQLPNTIAIGECGLDRTCETSFPLQIQIFKKQIQLAEELGKPLIIHAVKSYSDLLQQLKNRSNPTPWILHDYRGNAIQTTALYKHNIYFSFGRSLFQSAKTQKTFSSIPIERIFLETDESEFSITEVYQQAASIRKVSLEDLKVLLHKNFINIFAQNLNS